MTDKRNGQKGRRLTDEVCSLHQSLVDGQKDMRVVFRWLIALHIGEYAMIIGGLGAFVLFLLEGGLK